MIERLACHARRKAALEEGKGLEQLHKKDEL
jgi:hypothetical protein